jgi:peptidyl-prolyl cis-trans isomerase B (cyclophilin B)
MKLLAGLVMALTVAVAPATGFTQNNSTSKQGADMVTVTMETNKGVITLELDREKAPDSVENFITYAKSGHYDGTIFHRVIPGFMIQGGGFDTGMQQKDTNPQIKNEAENGLKNDKGTVAMARTNVPDSATSQFFINLKDNDFLNHTSPTPQGWGYAVFGKVTSGMDVVESIESVSTANKGGHQDVPVSEVIIEKVTVQE